EAGALLQAVLGEYIETDQQIVAHLQAALELEVDPLDYCAHRFGLGEALVLERAAEWAGLAFTHAIPSGGRGRAIIEKLERMGEVRALRMQLLDREVVYAAPRFETLSRLKPLLELRPDLHAMIAIVPGSAIRRELAALSQQPMMEAARHRLFRRWPRAAGHIDAPKPARI